MPVTLREEDVERGARAAAAYSMNIERTPDEKAPQDTPLHPQMAEYWRGVTRAALAAAIPEGMVLVRKELVEALESWAEAAKAFGVKARPGSNLEKSLRELAAHAAAAEKPKGGVR